MNESEIFALKFAKWIDHYGWRKHYHGLVWNETQNWWGGINSPKKEGLSDDEIMQLFIKNPEPYDIH